MTQPEPRYEADGGVTHLLRPGAFGADLRKSYCGLTRNAEQWKGADGPHEQLRAARMPTCIYCQQNAP
jgi:hypothetical protein